MLVSLRKRDPARIDVSFETYARGGLRCWHATVHLEAPGAQEGGIIEALRPGDGRRSCVVFEGVGDCGVIIYFDAVR